MKFIVEIFTTLIVVYTFLLFFFYIYFAIISVYETLRYRRVRKFTDEYMLIDSMHAPSISIIVPAYNEGKTIIESLRSILAIKYTQMEIIVVNDGSKDDTLDRLLEFYQLEPRNIFYEQLVITKPIKRLYRTRKAGCQHLIIVDKENGGKADALNAGINVSSNQYMICTDADCILKEETLLKMIRPFMEQSAKKIIAVGGEVCIINSCVVYNGQIKEIKVADEYLPRMQTIEYLRAFLLGRMAWSKMNGLILVSGALGAFDKDIVIKCGGYSHNIIGEDMELIVKMRRYMEENKEDYLICHVPESLCWTEVPETYQALSTQRNRWLRGSYETLKSHQSLFLNYRYRILGLFSFPYWLLFELYAPLVEFIGFIVFSILISLGYVDIGEFVILLLLVVCFAYFYSTLAIYLEIIAFNKYSSGIDILRLVLSEISEPFYYHPLIVLSEISGFIDLIRKKNYWGEMIRKGF